LFLGGSGSAWAEIKVAINEHALGKAVDKGACLDKEVVEHHVGFPPPKEADDIWVDIGTEEHHGASCPEGAGRDVTRAESHGVAHYGGHYAEGSSDVF